MNIDLETAGATPDRCLEALADETRRDTLSALREAGATLSVTELAVHLADADRDQGTVDADDPVRRREVALYHRHLPKLADAGLVEFDADRRTVALAPGFDDLEDATDLLAA